MWYRFVTYKESGNFFSLEVEVMAEGADIVAVPAAAAWDGSCPQFAKGRRAEIIERLKSVKWNRDLIWEDSDKASCLARDPSSDVVPGSLESTPGGRYLERLDLFGPDSEVKLAEARAMWSHAETQCAAQASGTVTILGSAARPQSMLKMVCLPALEKNPNVTIHFK